MKKIVSLFLAILMALSSLTFAPISAFAAIQGEIQSIQNPLLSAEAERFNAKKLKRNNQMTDVAMSIRDDFVMREENVEFSFSSDVKSKNELTQLLSDLCMYACDESLSESSVDGDYIRWHVSAYYASYEYDYDTASYTMSLIVKYYDTALEEKVLDNAVKNYLSTLDLNSYSDYELLSEFHDFVIESCDYNYFDMNHNHNFSAYGALCEGLAVCQGYALAFYRLCREVGFDVRIITSDPKVGCHAWNLVWVGDAYYYVDCTWDDDFYNQYYYFLVDYETIQSNDDNYEHLIFEEIFDNDYFNNNYRAYISENCYDASGKNISNCEITVDPANYNNFAVKDSRGNVLTNGVDYTVYPVTNAYSVIEGMGEYSGTYSLRDLSINYMTPYLNGTNFVYTGQEILPYVDLPGLMPNVDYKVLASNNIDAGTVDLKIIGVGKYSGVIYSQFTISKLDINNAEISLSYNQTYYDGTIKRPAVTVEGLVEGKDYTVSYDSTSLGTGYAYVSGIENCYGTAALSYQVVKRDISSQSIKLNNDNFEYNGSAKKPEVYIPGLVEGQDYILSYSNNIEPGTGTVKVKGINCYTGEVSVSFTILPKPSSDSKNSNDSVKPTVTKKSKTKKPSKVKLKKLKTAKKSIVVYWNKASSISGYQIEYAANSKFKKAKRVTVSSKKATSKKIAKLKKGKKYYVRVRAYKTVNGKKLYGSWSAKKSIVCK